MGALLLGLTGCATTPADRVKVPRAVIGESRAEKNQTGLSGLSDLAIQAIGLVGVPYKWGGNTPAGGFDCSGLVVYVAYRAKGLKLPRTVVEMSRFGQEVEVDQRLPGDLIFLTPRAIRFPTLAFTLARTVLCMRRPRAVRFASSLCCRPTGRPV